MPRSKYPEETLNKAAELRERGLSWAAISRKLNMSRGAVQWHCLRLGADAPDGHKYLTWGPGRAVVKRGNHVVRRFTPEEDRKILEMDQRGVSVKEIALALGRKHNSIIGRKMTLGRRDARLEAQREAGTSHG